METKHYNNQSDKLILVFAGWGTDSNLFSHLKEDEYDVIICYNFTRLDFDVCNTFECKSGELHPQCPLLNTFNRYREINIITWGFGVWIASITFDRYLEHLKPLGRFRTLRLLKKIRRSVAVNGTLCPVSNTWGIKQKVFNNTLKSLEQETREGIATNESATLQNFVKKMCGNKGTLNRFMAQVPQRALEDIYNELLAIKENYIFSNAIFWNKVIICDKDTIIPAKNQSAFWEEYEINIDTSNKLAFNANDFKIEHIEAYHYPFFKWNNWSEILK